MAGDFNNKYVEIENAFPEIFQAGFKKAVNFDRAKIEKYFKGDNTQIDHILYLGLTLFGSKVEWNYSDHSNLIAEFKI